MSGTTSSNLSTTYGYNRGGAVNEMVDAAGDTQSYAYDRLGRMSSRTDGLGETLSWTYDERGNKTAEITRESDPAVAVSWAYDKADRTTSRTADSATVTYGYNATGDLTSAASATGTISIGRNRFGLPTTVDPDNGVDTDYTYGWNTGWRTDQSGTYKFTFDVWGREKTMRAPLHANDFVFTYRPDGLIATRTDPHGVFHDYDYFNDRRLKRIISDDDSCSGTSCAEIAYTYNRAGVRLTEDSSIDGDPANGVATFEYDATGRLVDYDAPGAYDDQAYGWSEVLDRESLTIGANTTTTTFDAAHRPTADSGGGSYSHDADGRLTAQPGYGYVWDSLGRLTEVKDGQGTTLSTYTYDALDRLRDVTSAGSTIRHRYVGATTQVSQFKNITTGSNVRKFVNTWAGETVARFTTTTTGRRYFGRNGHGDITWTTSGSGAVDRSVRYDPWGDAIAAPSGQLDFGFQGSWRDPATDHYWVVTRWYAPALGTFISEDSLLGAPTNPLSRHLYAYGGGDPVNTWDPDGRLFEDLKGVVRDFVKEHKFVFGCLDGGSARDCKIAQALIAWTRKKANQTANRAVAANAGPNGKDGRHDAITHCLIASSLTCTVGPKQANNYLKWNEYGEPTDTHRRRIRQKMDLHNNKVGVRIGNNARRKYPAKKEAIKNPLVFDPSLNIADIDWSAWDARMAWSRKRCAKRLYSGLQWMKTASPVAGKKRIYLVNANGIVPGTWGPWSNT